MIRDDGGDLNDRIRRRELWIDIVLGIPDAASGRAQAETDCVRAKGFPSYHHTGVYAGCAFTPHDQKR